MYGFLLKQKKNPDFRQDSVLRFSTSPFIRRKILSYNRLYYAYCGVKCFNYFHYVSYIFKNIIFLFYLFKSFQLICKLNKVLFKIFLNPYIRMYCYFLVHQSSHYILLLLKSGCSDFHIKLKCFFRRQIEGDLFAPPPVLSVSFLLGQLITSSHFFIKSICNLFICAFVSMCIVVCHI